MQGQNKHLVRKRKHLAFNHSIMYKRKKELVNEIFKQKGGSCQSAATKHVFELKYFEKYGKKLDLDYYKFYKRLKVVHPRGDYEKMSFVIDLLKSEGMYCKKNKEYYKIKSGRLFYSYRNRYLFGRNPYSKIIGGEPLVLDCMWESQKLSAVGDDGVLSNYERVVHHAMAGICGDKHNIDVIWVANSHGVKATGTDNGWFKFKRKNDTKHFPLILEAYQITV